VVVDSPHITVLTNDHKSGRKPLRTSCKNIPLRQSYREEVGLLEWPLIVALVVCIPLAMLPAIFMLYLNIGGVYQMIRGMEKRQTCLDRRIKVLISVLLAPITLLIVIPVFLALVSVSLPILILAVPIFMALGLTPSLKKIPFKRLRRARVTG